MCDQVSLLASDEVAFESPPMAVFGSLATVRAQLAYLAPFRATFAYLEDCMRLGTEASRRLRAMEVGQQERTELADGAFALEQVYLSKLRPDAFFESHRKYIDVQVIIAGEEFIEVSEIAKLQVKEDRTPEKDVIIYHQADNASVLRLGAGDAAVLFPVDGHMPTVAIKEPALVRKIVVKVPVS